MCAFILQAISSEREFGIRLNKSFERHGSLPGNVRIPAFHGTYADFMIIVSLIIMTTHQLLTANVYSYFCLLTHFSSLVNTSTHYNYTWFIKPNLSSTDNYNFKRVSLSKELVGIVIKQASTAIFFIYHSEF